MANDLNPTSIQPAAEALAATPLFLASTDSTNSESLRLLHGRAELPALIVAAQQTAGRGRSGNVWWSNEGSLTFTLAWPMGDEFKSQASRPWSLLAGLAVHQACSVLCPDIDFWVKWPNDVYAAPAHSPWQKKLAGILVEVVSQPRPTVVIGIGVNVNNSLHNAPDDVRSRATSLVDLTGRRLELSQVLQQVCMHLRGQLTAASAPPLPAQWQGRCLLTGRNVRVVQGERVVEGRCEGIDTSGALLLQTQVGLQAVASGVVDWFETQPPWSGRHED